MTLGVNIKTDSLSNNSLRNIFRNIFDKNGHLLLLLDTSYKNYIFDDFFDSIDVNNIEYIPLGLSKKKSDLFFLKINNLNELNEIAFNFIEYLELNYHKENFEYYVHGFGATQLVLSTFIDYFKKSIVLNDSKGDFIFRWYDPRVMIHLEKILGLSKVESLLSIFSEWNFIHPLGLYNFKNPNISTKVKKLNSINKFQSMQLDDIEIVNLIYREIHKSFYFTPQQILIFLENGRKEYLLVEYDDLFTYGYYCCVVNPDFMRHNLIVGKYNENIKFSKFIELIDLSVWEKVQNDLEGDNHG